jgi:hypothetical protein
MSRLGRAVAAGVAGFGSRYLSDLDKQKEQERVDERLAKEDAFKERQLEIQESDLEIRRAAAERQEFFDNTKKKHLEFSQQMAAAMGNKKQEMKIMSNLFPDKKQYEYDEHATNNMVHPETGKKPYAVINMSFLDQDPVTNEVRMDPDTGAPKKIYTKAPTDKMVFWDKADYYNRLATNASPDIFTATAAADYNRSANNEAAIKRVNDIADTVTGQSQLAKEAADTDLAVAKAEKLRAEVKSGVYSKNKKAVGSVMGLDGNDVKLSTPEVNQLINDTKSMKEKYPGINSGEAYRLSEAMESPARVRGLQTLAQQVVNEETPKSQAISELQTAYRLTKQTATDLLNEQIQGVENNAPSWFDNWWNRGPKDQQGATAEDQSLANEARDFD